MSCLVAQIRFLNSRLTRTVASVTAVDPRVREDPEYEAAVMTCEMMVSAS